MLRTFKSRVVRRTFWLIKMVPTWKKFEKRWPKAFLGVGITHMSSRMFFTSIPRYLNSVALLKDILKRLSITWNCKCCNYTGSLFCPTRIVGHFTDSFAWRWVVLPSPQFEFTVSCVPRRFDRCIAVVLGLSHHKTVRRWTGLIQCVAFNSGF